MPFLNWRIWSIALALLALVGCGGASTREGDVEVALQGTFQKRILTTAGFTNTELRPARFAYAEVYNERDRSRPMATGYLDENGHGFALLPSGVNVFLVLYARVEVPGATPFALRGSVKQGSLDPAHADFQNLDAFNGIADWTVLGSSTTVGTRASLSATATGREAAAFNIADQLVTYGRGVQMAEPGLRLPNLHAFWTDNDLDPASNYTSAPVCAWNLSKNLPLVQDSGRAVFTFRVQGNSGSVADPFTYGDAFNDSAVQRAMVRQLFADRSYPEDGSKLISLLRRDNDNTYVSRGYQSESTIAFTEGFGDVLTAAFRSNPTLITVSDTGTITTFRLDAPSPFPHAAGQGEFYRDAVSNSLYGIWQNVLGGTQAGLQTLWKAAAFPHSPVVDLEYLNAPLGCYPTYLRGLKKDLSATQWNAALGELAKEAIGDVTTPAYFNSTALWLFGSTNFSTSGTLQTYASPVYYDRNQSEAYLFTQVFPADRTITLSLTGGQDFFLELIGPTGLVDGSYQPTGTGIRTLALRNLPAGTYVARVRAGNTTANNNAAGYTLSIQ